MRRLPQILFLLIAGWRMAAAGQTVSFQKDVAPLLQRHCLTCHSEENSKGGYRLDSFAQLMKAGDSDLAAVTPGRPENSELYRLLLESDPHDRMPQKADALPVEEIACIEQWIRSGAPYDGGAPDRPLIELAREALLRPAPATYPRPIPVAALAYSPDGKLMATNGYYEVNVWNAADGSLVRRIQGLPEQITSISWRREALAITGGSPGQWGTVALVSAKADAPPRILCDLPEAALCASFSPDGTQLVVGSGDRTVRIFETGTGKVIRTLRQHADLVQSVSFNSTGSAFVTTSRDRTARVIDVSTGEVESTYTGHEAPLLFAFFSPDSSRVYSLDRTRILQTWDIKSQKKISEVRFFDSDPRRMLILRDKLITIGSTPLVTVDQFSDRQRLFTLYGHRSPVQAIAASPDNRQFATGSADGEVLIWDLACGTWVTRFVASPQAPAK